MIDIHDVFFEMVEGCLLIRRRRHGRVQLWGFFCMGSGAHRNSDHATLGCLMPNTVIGGCSWSQSVGLLAITTIIILSRCERLQCNGISDWYCSRNWRISGYSALQWPRLGIFGVLCTHVEEVMGRFCLYKEGQFSPSIDLKYSIRHHQFTAAISYLSSSFYILYKTQNQNPK